MSVFLVLICPKRNTKSTDLKVDLKQKYVEDGKGEKKVNNINTIK